MDEDDNDTTVNEANFDGLGTNWKQLYWRRLRTKLHHPNQEKTKIATKDYIKWIENQLEKTVQEVPRSYVTGLHEDAEDFLKQVEFLLSKKEKEFIDEALFLKAIPQLQLLVKDHKDPNEKGNFPTRLLCPGPTARPSPLGPTY
eukprot:10917340-Ditylum_brightwellii.AAC.1